MELRRGHGMVVMPWRMVWGVGCGARPMAKGTRGNGKDDTRAVAQCPVMRDLGCRWARSERFFTVSCLWLCWCFFTVSEPFPQRFLLSFLYRFPSTLLRQLNVSLPFPCSRGDRFRTVAEPAKPKKENGKETTPAFPLATQCVTPEVVSCVLLCGVPCRGDCGWLRSVALRASSCARRAVCAR